MARISTEVIQKRESFLTELFAQNQTLTINKANELLKAQFGRMMRPFRVAELKNQASNGKVVVNVSSVKQ